MTQHSPATYASIELQPGAAFAIDHEADERALYLLDGDFIPLPEMQKTVSYP